MSSEKDEATAVTGFEELSAAKAAEIASATSAIESKTKRSGEVAVEVVQTKDDLEDTLEEVKETQAFLGDLGKQCAEKKADWSERQKMRAEEVSAISEAIKVLNDDDALDLFKKAVPPSFPFRFFRFVSFGSCLASVDPQFGWGT